MLHPTELCCTLLSCAAITWAKNFFAITQAFTIKEISSKNHQMIQNRFFASVPKSPTQMGSLCVKKTRRRISYAWAPLRPSISPDGPFNKSSRNLHAVRLSNSVHPLSLTKHNEEEIYRVETTLEKTICKYHHFDTVVGIAITVLELSIYIRIGPQICEFQWRFWILK